jgi:hypothetical protein
LSAHARQQQQPTQAKIQTVTAAEQIANAIATVLKAQEEKDLADANVLGAQKKKK